MKKNIFALSALLGILCFSLPVLAMYSEDKDGKFLPVKVNLAEENIKSKILELKVFDFC